MQTLQKETDEITKDYYNELVSFLKAAKDSTEKAKADSPLAKTLISKTDHYYESAIQSLSSISGARFGEPSAGDKLSDGISHATGAIAGLFSGLSEHSDSKTLRDLYTGLTASSCGFQMLYSTEVSGYGKSAHSENLLSLIKNHHQLIMEYGHVIPQVVIADLASDDEGSFDISRTDGIVSDLQSSWH